MCACVLLLLFSAATTVGKPRSSCSDKQCIACVLSLVIHISVNRDITLCNCLTKSSMSYPPFFLKHKYSLVHHITDQLFKALPSDRLKA